MGIMVTIRSVLIYLRDISPPEEVEAKIWTKRYLIATAAMGIGWVIIVFLGISEDLFTRMLIVMLVIGIISAAVPVLGAFPIGLKIYILPPMLACVIRLVSLNEFDSSMLALALTIYTLMILRSANNFFDTLIASLQFQFENQELAERLRSEKYSADALNSQLVSEIRDRQVIQKQLEIHQDNLESQVEARTAELMSAKIEAEAGSRAKSNFLATMSHEIRTPLNGVLGMLELLRETDMNDKQKHYATVAYLSGNTLLGLINNILDFSKIEAERVFLNKVPFDIKKVVEDALGIVSEQARAKEIDLEMQYRI
jgi:signal transduction histidine kinase